MDPSTLEEHGNYYSILGLYGDTGKEHGNYYLGCRVGVKYSGFVGLVV